VNECFTGDVAFELAQHETGASVFKFPVESPFAAHAKVLWPCTEILEPDDVIARHVTAHPAGGWTVEPGWRDALAAIDERDPEQAPFRYRRVTLRELAARSGLRIVPASTVHSIPVGVVRWGWSVHGPSEGRAGGQVLGPLLSALQPFSQPGRLSSFWNLWPLTHSAETTLCRGAPRDLIEDFPRSLPESLQTAGYGEDYYSPEWIWPADAGWLIQNDYDSTFSVVGGSRAAIDALLQDAELEAIEITPDTQHDGYGTVDYRLI
jgi:hypothetical protein